MQRFLEKLFQPVSVYSVVFFRVALGGILLWKVFDYLEQGRVERYWLEPTFNFKYSLFPWVTALPGEGMFYLFYALGALAVFVIVGFLYRPALLLLALSWGYTFLLEEARYLNHDYLVILLCFLLAFVPANRALSVDALLFKKVRGNTLPVWGLWLLRFQIGVPYFFGGIAKLQPDWLRGEPMRTWLGRRTEFPVVGQLFTQEWVVYLATYGGLVLDLVAVPLLLWSKTRPYIFAFLVLFHFTNARWFNIGIFPWLMIAATTIFFPPDWPKALWQGVRANPTRLGLPCLLGGLFIGSVAAWFYEQVDIPVFFAGFVAGALIVWSLVQPLSPDKTAEKAPQTSPRYRPLTVGLLSVWVAVQVLLPLRHWTIPGDPNWTEEGHRFAWHMLLRTKQSRLTYVVTDPATGQQGEVDPSDILAGWQVSRLENNPHMMLQFAHYIAEKFEEDGLNGVEVRAIAETSLNGRDYQFILDPTLDLARVPETLWHADWIMPLETPLKSAQARASK